MNDPGNYKPRIPDRMEAVFDIGYLTFDLIAGILYFLFFKKADPRLFYMEFSRSPYAAAMPFI